MEKIFVKLTFAFSLLVLLWITLFNNADYLYDENRTASNFSLSKPDKYFADRIPFRKELLLLNRDISRAIGKNEFAGAFFGKNGYVFSNEDTSTEVLEKNLAAAEEFGAALCIVPSKTDALLTLLPRFFESGRGNLWQSASKCKTYIADVGAVLRLEGANGKYIYYRGDHHLTSLGSYYLYKSLASTLDYEAYGANDFVPTVVKSDFSGSDARKMLVETNDKVTLFRYKGDNGFLTENVDTGEKYGGLYNYGCLNTHNPYGVFPVSDAGRVKINLDKKDRQNLLLVCDSYGDSLAPFLARHFDLDIIDPRYYGGSVKELVNENNYSKILLCFGMDTIASREVLYKLKF